MQAYYLVCFFKQFGLTSCKVHESWPALTTGNHFTLQRHYQRAKVDLPSPHDPQVHGANLQKVKDSDLIKHVKKILTSKGQSSYRTISIYCSIYLSRKSLDNRTFDSPLVRQRLPLSTSEKSSMGQHYPLISATYHCHHSVTASSLSLPSVQNSADKTFWSDLCIRW